MVVEKRKGVNMTSKVLHQAGCLNEIELCEIANLIYPSDISIFGRERRKVQGKRYGLCLDSGSRRLKQSQG